MINFSTVNKIIGTLLFLEAVMMTICLGISVYVEGEDASAFFFSVIFTILGGVIFKYLGRHSDNSLGRREAYLLVTVTWIIFSIFGSLPFIISGYIKNFTVYNSNKLVLREVLLKMKASQHTFFRC